VVVALVFSTGGHWALLQVGAWAGMVVSYSQTDSLADALVKTFDGEHPCKLCKVVKEGRKAEQEKPVTLKVEQKLDFFLAVQTVTISAPQLLRHDTRFSTGCPSRHDPPLLRPPIFA
jgi:hypothetical protein